MTESKNFRNEYPAGKSNEIFSAFTASFRFDRRLFYTDVRVSIAYADALFHAGIVTRLEAEKIRNGLETLLKRADFDKNYFDDSTAVDIYSFIETKLVQLIGETGEKLQIGRSRNDQTATTFRLWLREEIEAITDCVEDLQKAFFDAAEKQKTTILPGNALQRRAGPILWAHWCLTYFEMFARDRERLDEVWRRTNVLPLGSGILAGNSFEIDREALARQLDFEGVTTNSLDAVADRDFAVEFVGAASLVMIHLSRLAEDLIVYASTEFGFVEFSGAEAKYSLTALPQNLAALELIRGKAGRISGHQSAILSVMKNLPLGCGADLREVEETVFDTVDTIKICLEITAAVLRNLRVNEKKTLQAAGEYINPAELADYLIKKGVTLRAAQLAADKIIFAAVSKNKRLDEFSLKELREFQPEIEADIFDALTLAAALANKSSIGGTAPEQVEARLEEISREFEREL